MSYSVPIPAMNFDSATLLQEAMNSLEILSTASDDIFDKILLKVNEERNRLQRCNSRIDSCDRRLQAIRASKKAITIYSTPKYPSRKLEESLHKRIFFANQIVGHRPFSDVDNCRNYSHNKSISIGNDSTIPTPSMVRLQLKNIQSKDPIKKVEFIMEEQGIGSIPRALKSSESFLLFNSALNPYHKYQNYDNLITIGVDRNSDNNENQEDDKNEEIASHQNIFPSILTRDILPDVAALDLSFHPEAVLPISLPLPANLPLDFLSELQFNGSPSPSSANFPSSSPSTSARTSQAPSSNPTVFKDLPQLPTVLPPSILPTVPSPPLLSTTTTELVPDSGRHANSSILSPQLPPPPLISNPSNHHQSRQQQHLDINPSTGKLPAAALLSPQSLDQSLLESIRGSSLKKLKPVTESPDPPGRSHVGKGASSNKAAATVSGPVSMMDEMRERMARRNRAMSGKTEPSTASTEPSQNPPPPPPPSSHQVKGGGQDYPAATTSASNMQSRRVEFALPPPPQLQQQQQQQAQQQQTFMVRNDALTIQPSTNILKKKSQLVYSEDSSLSSEDTQMSELSMASIQPPTSAVQTASNSKFISSQSKSPSSFNPLTETSTKYNAPDSPSNSSALQTPNSGLLNTSHPMLSSLLQAASNIGVSDKADNDDEWDDD